MDYPTAELVATGAELLNGRGVNTHAQRLGAALAELGIVLTREMTVPDDCGAIADAVREALARAPLVFVTGGLGPTCDDLTRDALSALFGRPLVSDPETLATLRRRYEAMGRSLSPSRATQALALAGAAVLSNSAGAAPGQRIEDAAGRVTFVLPGPPPEFDAILREHILPWLRAHRPEARPIPERICLVCGVAESDVVERLSAAGFDPAPVALAYCAAPGALEVRLTGAPGQEAAVAERAAALRALLGEDVFAEGRMDLAEVVGARLRAVGGTVATAESCTGGGVGERLTAVAGASAWYRGGVVAYANDVKARVLGVDPAVLEAGGAVSEAVACQMAAGARRVFGAEYAIAITGIAGPGGGTPAKPVGTVWMAVEGPDGGRTACRRFPGPRGQVRRWAAQTALDLLRRMLGPRA
jgi:nicotinamide-nucleotide amidase